MQEEHDETHNEDNDISDEVLLDIEVDVEETPQDPLALEQEKSNDLFDRLQRLQAEFDNYRKRMDSRILEARKFASEDILLKFLDIYQSTAKIYLLIFQNLLNLSVVPVTTIPLFHKDYKLSNCHCFQP